MLKEKKCIRLGRCYPQCQLIAVLMKYMDSAYNQCLRVVTGCTQSTPINLLHECAGAPTLTTRIARQASNIANTAKRHPTPTPSRHVLASTPPKQRIRLKKTTIMASDGRAESTTGTLRNSAPEYINDRMRLFTSQPAPGVMSPVPNSLLQWNALMMCIGCAKPRADW
eukprot:scpid101759/ scgid7429/ 